MNNQDLELRIQATIDAKNSAKTVGELRKSIKDLNSLMLEFGDESPDAFNKLSVEVGKATDKIKDIKESVDAVSGEPIERLGGSFAFVKDSIVNLDFGKAATGVKLFTDSFKELSAKNVTNSLKELTVAISDLGKTLLKSVGDNIKDRISSLKEGFTAFGGSIKQVFGGDFVGALNSVKSGFTALGDALKVNPIFLLASVIILIITKFDELKTAGGLVGKTFQAIGQVIKAVTDIITAFTDAIGLTNIEGEKQTKKFLDNKNKEKDALTARYDAEIALAQAAGQETTILELQKTQAVKNNVSQQIQKLEELKTANGELTDDEKKNLDELKVAFQKLKDDELTIEAKANKELLDLNKNWTKQVEQNEINLIKDKNKRAIAQADYDSKYRQQDITNERIAGYQAIQAKYQARLDAAKVGSKEYNDLLKQQDAEEAAFRAASSKLQTSEEQSTQAEIGRIRTEAAKEAFEKAKAKAKENYDAQLNLVKQNYQDIATLDTQFNADRLNKQVTNLEQQESIIKAYYDTEVKRAGYTKQQKENLRLQEQKEISALYTERDKQEKDYTDFVIAQTNKRNQAIADLNVLQAKSDKQLLDAQINQIKVKASIDIQDKTKTEEEKKGIEAKALNDIQALRDGYRDKQNAAELQAVQNRVDIASIELTNDEKIGNLRVKGRIALLEKLKNLEIQSLQSQAQQQIDIINQQEQKELSSKDLSESDKTAITAKYAQQRKDVEEKTADEIKQKELDTQKAVLDAKLASTNQGLQIAQSAAGALGALNDLITQGENQNLKKGEKASVELQKRQFKRQKALGIVNAAINTAQGITAALGSAPPPYNIILAAITGAAGALQIAAIASKKFNPDSAGGDSGSSAPSIPSANSASFNAPSLSDVGLNNSQANTPQSANSNRIYVLESDITSKQNKIANIQNRAKIG